MSTFHKIGTSGHEYAINPTLTVPLEGSADVPQLRAAHHHLHIHPPHPASQDPENYSKGIFLGLLLFSFAFLIFFPNS